MVTTLEKGDHVTPVDPINIGEQTACLETGTLSQHHQPKQTTDFVKDEYSFNFSSHSFDDTHFTNLTNNYYEYEQGEADIIVKGRLKKTIQFWVDIGAYAYDFIIEAIRDGYKIPIILILRLLIYLIIVQP